MFREKIISFVADDSIYEDFIIDLKSFNWHFDFLLKKKDGKYEVESGVTLSKSVSFLLSKAESTLKIRFLSQKEDVPDVEKSLKWINSQKECEFDKFEIDAAAFVANKKVHVKMSVTIDYLPGNHLPGIDFSQPTNHSDVVLVVNGNRLHVNKAYLAMYSKVFDKMFFSEFKEATQEEIVLEGLIHYQFYDLLQHLYPGASQVEDDNWKYLLELADRFDIPKVMYDCEQYLINTSEVSPRKKFIHADKYSMIELYGDVVCKLTKDTIRGIKKLLAYKDLKAESKDILLDKALNL